MIKWVMICCMMCSVHILCAQGKYEGRRDLMDRTTNPGQVVDELPLPPAGIKGTSYLYDNWCFGKIHLTNGQSITGYLLRYDVMNKHVEVKTGEAEKVCPYHMINSFILYTNNNEDSIQFIKTEKFKFSDNTPSIGFFEVLYKGEYALVRYHDTDIKQADYVEAFNMGNRDKEIVIKEKEYLIHNNEVICEFKRRLKSMEVCLPGDMESHQSFIKENNINLKKADGKRAFLQYLNKL